MPLAFLFPPLAAVRWNQGTQLLIRLDFHFKKLYKGFDYEFIQNLIEFSHYWCFQISVEFFSGFNLTSVHLSLKHPAA